MKRKATLDTARLIHKYLTIFSFSPSFLISTTTHIRLPYLFFFLSFFQKRYFSLSQYTYISQRLFLFIFGYREKKKPTKKWVDDDQRKITVAKTQFSNPIYRCLENQCAKSVKNEKIKNDTDYFFIESNFSYQN